MTNSAFVRWCCTSALLILAPTVAAAQPRAGQIAAGGDVGLFLPSDDQFDTALIWGGFLEGYLTPRIGIRGGVFRTSPEYERGTDEHERQTRVGVDLIYNWEGGKWHPFAGAGLGLHFIQFTDNGESIGDSDSRGGFNILGGLEYFLNRAWTVKGEARYQWVDDERGVNPDGLALTLGLKRYF